MRLRIADTSFLHDTSRPEYFCVFVMKPQRENKYLRTFPPSQREDIYQPAHPCNMIILGTL